MTKRRAYLPTLHLPVLIERPMLDPIRSVPGCGRVGRVGEGRVFVPELNRSVMFSRSSLSEVRDADHGFRNHREDDQRIVSVVLDLAVMS